MKNKAQATFVSEFEALRTFCENHTSLDVFTMAETYPFTVQFVRARTQGRLFDDEPAAPNGPLVEAGLLFPAISAAAPSGLLVEVGLPTKVTVPEGFSLDAALLKKLIRMAEQVGLAYYHAFREEADDAKEETK